MADYTSTTSLPAELQPVLAALASRGLGLSNQIFSGARTPPNFAPNYAVPDFNAYQQALVNPALGIASRSSEGYQTADVGNLALRGTMNGQFYNRPGTQNPYEGMYVDPAANPYAGENPYLQSMINKGMGDVSSAYQRTIAPQTDAMSALSHTYGGSAHQENIANNQKVLADALSNISNQYRFQDYGTQQQLAEAGINRGVQTQQADLARNAGLAQQQINQGETSFQNERQRALQAASLSPAMAGLDAASLGPLQQIGNAQYGITQGQQTFGLNQTLQQQFPELFGMDVLRNTLSPGTGSTTTVSGGSNTNPFLQGLGAIGAIGQIGGFNWLTGR